MAGETVRVTNPDGSLVAAATGVASGAAVTRVDDSAASVQLLAANGDRRGCALYNDSDEIAYVKFGVDAAADDFTIKMAADSYYEFPNPIYPGRVDCIWAADGTGAMQITELE